MALRQAPVEKFRSREQQATLGLLRTADAIKRHFSQVIERHGITLQQYNVLRILRGAGPDGLPTLTIGERMIEQTTGVTRPRSDSPSKSKTIRSSTAISRA